MAWTIENTSPIRGLDSDLSREREVEQGGGFADLLAREQGARVGDDRRPLAMSDERDGVRRSDEERPAARDEDDAAEVGRRRDAAQPQAAADDRAREVQPAVTKAEGDRPAAAPATYGNEDTQAEQAVTPGGKTVATSHKATTGGTVMTARVGADGLSLAAAPIMAPTTTDSANPSTSTSTSTATKGMTETPTTVMATASSGQKGGTTQPAAATPVLAAAMAALVGTGTAGATATGTTGAATATAASGTTTIKPTHATAAAALTPTITQPAEAWLRTLVLASGQGQTATDGNDGESAGHPAARAAASLGLDPAVLESGGRAAPTTDGGTPIVKAAEPTPQGPSRALCEALGQLATRFDDLPPGASRVAQMTVRLTPEGFGSVELGVRLQAGVVHVVVRCESERTARALRAETGALRRAFAGSKLELDGVDIETTAGGAGRGAVAASEDSAGAEGLV